MRRSSLLVLLLLPALLLAQQIDDCVVTLRCPLTAVLDLRRHLDVDVAGPIAGITVSLTVPEQAPADLGIGAWCTDRHGRWFQSLHQGSLEPGRHELQLDFDQPVSEPGIDGWRPDLGGRVYRAGLLFWGSRGAGQRIRIHSLTLQPGAPGAAAAVLPGRLCDLRLPPLQDGLLQGRTGQRLELRCQPDPFPADPFASSSLQLDLVVTRPDGVEERLPAFFEQRQRLRDQGDGELAEPLEAGCFTSRYRPRLPGVHRLVWEGRWQEGEVQRFPVPDLSVSGPAWDDYVRVDEHDPRFFVTGVGTGTTRLYWPIGLNLRSLYDTRSHDNRHFTTRLTPDRGAHAYLAYLRRLAAAGGTAAEVWMASWNLALEWRRDWPGYHGLGAYNQANAARLDRILDAAHRLGIRINLVIHNHGAASGKTNVEWHDSPYNRANGGVVDQPSEFFTDPQALAYQQRLRRYIVGRYADHPAILGWKLFSEINLTAADREVRTQWFADSAAAWQAMDSYGHPTTTHWSGDYRTPDSSICELPQADYLCIDAYHHRKRKRKSVTMLVDLIADGMLDQKRGLARFGKPLLVTEFGGSHKACPEDQLLAEHRSGPWAALISGNAGSPMLWWWEWVDQNDHWQVYGALSAFIAGEDLRSLPGSPAWAARLQCRDPDGRWWSGAWVRAGRLLGYACEPAWATHGTPAAEAVPLRCHIGDRVAAGRVQVEWWDADRGVVLERKELDHAGGRLELVSPAVRHHVAFKMWRPDSDR